MPTYVHRNYVSFEDQNTHFALGVGGRFKFTKRFGIIADYFYVFRDNKVVDGAERFNPLALGLEIETGGHVFHINFSNSSVFPNFSV